jgi:exodeoxyribonuclease V gamma subunit
MELLESPYIRKRFGITDTDALRTAVRQAGIIYSLDGREADDTRMVSWNYGLKKLLYGLCMSGSEPFHDGRDEVIPLDTDEGPSALERVRLIHFMRILQEKLEARKTRRTIAGWADHLRELMEDMVFQAGEQDDEDHPRFIDLIEQLATLDENMSLEVDFEVFRHSFLHRLSLERKSQNFLGAGITFCSLVPMRSIPFRVVAMLGMNFDKFPRKETPVSFSLITRDPRPGDRNVRNNDRHLFLETLLSARESLYISYIAKSEKDAEDIPPASLVDELIDYAAQGMEVDTDKLRQQWITIHPLHGFGKLYFGPGAPANYLSEDRYRTRIEVRPKDPTPPESPAAVLDLETLVQFLQNPPKFNLNRRFNVYYRDEELLLPEHEVFELQSFESWQVRKDIIELEPNALNEYARQKVRTGGLPLSNMGRASVRRTYEELETMRADVMSARAGLQPDSVAIDLAFGDIRLTGKVDGLYGNRLVEPCHSSDHYRHLLAAWLRYLALRAMGVTAEFAFIKNKMKGIHLVPADKVSTEQALRMLADCIEYYRQGLAGHFHFFPALAMNNFKMLTGDHAFFLGQYELELENRMSFKFNDPYLRKAIEQGFFAAENYAALHANTHAIMGPIRKLMPELFPGK